MLSYFYLFLVRLYLYLTLLTLFRQLERLWFIFVFSYWALCCWVNMCLFP